MGIAIVLDKRSNVGHEMLADGTLEQGTGVAVHARRIAIETS
jgi:hypothetical protein